MSTNGQPELGRRFAVPQLLVEHDHVVQALSPEGADDAFGDRVRTRRPNRRGDGVDPDSLGAQAEIAPVDGISISQQVARACAAGCGPDHLAPDPSSRRLVVTFTCTSLRRPCAINTSTYSDLNVRVGTVNRSVA